MTTTLYILLKEGRRVEKREEEEEEEEKEGKEVGKVSSLYIK